MAWLPRTSHGTKAPIGWTSRPTLPRTCGKSQSLVAALAAKTEALAHTYATVRRLGLADPGRRPTARGRERLQLAG